MHYGRVVLDYLGLADPFRVVDMGLRFLKCTFATTAITLQRGWGWNGYWGRFGPVAKQLGLGGLQVSPAGCRCRAKFAIV